MQRFTFRLLFVLGMVHGIANAQFNSAIQGLITDSSGAPVPGATVSVKNLETGIVRTADTMNDGLYRVLSLGPGTYQINFKRRVSQMRHGMPSSWQPATRCESISRYG